MKLNENAPERGTFNTMTALLRPVGLRCEYLVNPLGLDILQPRLFWTLSATQPEERNIQQNAYQILVASSPELLDQENGDLWDSGKVVSTQSTHIPYAGKPLASRQRCWWRVRVWDQNNGLSTFSETAYWEMGLLHAEEWQGQWIGLPLPEPYTDLDDQDREVMKQKPGLQTTPYLRRDLTIAQPVRQARLYITARGVYEFSINGQRVSDNYFTPGWTDYNKRIQYQTYDVTALLTTGKNQLDSIIGTGWYCGYVGYSAQTVNWKLYGTSPRLLCQLHIDYSDGSSEIIASDTSWQAAPGPIIYSDIQMGELYDARRQPENWQPVISEERDAIPLVAEKNEPVRCTKTLHPQSINEVQPGVYIFDMGQNMVGWVQLHVKGPAGSRVQLRFTEMLNPDGTLYTTSLRSALQTDTYILAGNGEVEIFEPHFSFHGFRYVEVTGYPGQPTLETLVGRVVHSDTPEAGTFECSQPMVNKLQQNITWGQRGNFLSVPTDCPQRDERLGWLGDAQVFVRNATYNMDVAAFFSKWMDDVSDTQAADGGFANVAPRVLVKDNAAPAWGDAGVIVPWTIYQVYGDTAIIERHYTAMTRWVEYVQEANPNLLWVNKTYKNYGDWLSIDADTPKDVLATAYFAYDALLLSRMARVINRLDDANKYHQLYKDISKAFCKAYVSDNGRIKGDTQTVYLLALHMELIPETLRPLAAQYLAEDIKRRNYHLSTGFVGVGYLCPILSQTGYNDIAYRLLLNDTFPSWGYSIKQGATTIWERWDGWTEDKGFQDPAMNSFNHYSLGSVGQWLFQYVAGIDVIPEHPGFQQIKISPYPDKQIDSVRATYRSLHGPISSVWTLNDDTFTLNITIPANTSAQVSLPVGKGQSVYEGEKPVTQATGVTFQHVEGDRHLFKIGSGSYTFVVR